MEEQEQQGYTVIAGPQTGEEQFHFDLMCGHLDWGRNNDKEPHSADLFAEVLGTEILEMDADLLPETPGEVEKHQGPAEAATGGKREKEK